MFYSQFILAKKGPLGTIWIAAHLERKLRKNQVADTDIGVSVDSILFPDVPIALRLSSHLLLGVVRIYSRKVNYLFDDCSEALLKVKQAFRSTAVDLPPEESKAPYHSITLPETFDLDDFELPDNDIFQGNFVDHHISSREQITLQDNMEGVVYSTSQFGLDERFGDADTSGLDLDEELLMGKVDAAGYSGVSADPQTSFNSMTHVKLDEHELDEHDEGLLANAESQMENVVGDVGLMDYAQAPSTPGLVEEPNLSNVQETSCCDDHIESEETHLTEFAVKDLENASTRLILHQGHEPVVDWSIPNDSNSDAAPCNGYHTSEMGNEKGFSSPTEDSSKHISSEDCVAASGQPFVGEVGTDHDKQILVDKIIAASDDLDREEHLEDGNAKVDRVDVPAVDVSHEDHELNGTISEGGAEHATELANSAKQVFEGSAEKSNGLLHAGDSERPSSPRDALSIELQVTSGLEKPEISLGQVMILRPCNADLGKPDPSHTGTENSMDLEPCDIALVQLDTSERADVSRSMVVQGEICNSVGDSEQILKEKHILEPSSPEDVCAGSVKLDDHGNNMMQGDTAGIECPAPEKMLSVPEGFNDQPRNLHMESTPADMAHVDESDAGSRIVSGKKRSYTESTLTEQSLNSIESSRAIRIKKTVEAIPDDDDLLSSILVGRRSSVLKVKPTPLPGEITSLKRHRTAPRTSSKRKVLMDDTMVLHGDTIRQQLMNTEDIRRLRKKAPCTRPEIAMIQRQFLEDQIFRVSLFSGVSIYLASLHNKTYDLSGIRIYKDEVNDSFGILATEPISTSKKDETAENIVTENAMDSGGPTAIVGEDRDEARELETVRENGEIQSGQTCELINDLKLGEVCEPTEDLGVASDPSSLQIEPLQDLAGNEVGGSSSIAEAVNPACSLEIGPSDRVTSDVGDMSCDAVQPALLDDRCEMDASVQMDKPLISCDEKRESECVEVDASVMHRVTEKVNNDDTVYVGDLIASDEIGHSAKDEFSQEASESAAAVEIDKVTHDLVEYNDNGPSVETKADMDDHGRIYDGISGEEPLISLSSPAVNFTSQVSFLLEREDFMLLESNPGNMVDADVSGVNIHDCDEPNYSAAANDTDFLNVDDDEVAEVTDDYIPDTEEIRFTENSGWSSRTRAVAKYLKTLFVQEAECDRKVIPMDNLLLGKTRKEASRMFFEALVLKTRDYIHVEQQCPFDNIAIKPKAKLVKSDF